MNVEQLLKILQLAQAAQGTIEAVSGVIASHREAARAAAQGELEERELLALIDKLTADYDARIAARSSES